MIIIAHNIRSLHNVGSIFRSADAFAVDKVYLTGYTGQPPRREIAKVALGSENRVKWEYFDDILPLIEHFKADGYRIYALETEKEAISIDQVELSDKVALIVGNEVQGIEKQVLEQVDQVVEIPMIGAKKSLNVSVAAGIAMFALAQKKT